MIKVNNKKAIRKIANSSFKANKLRNIFAVISLILTTVMFTTLFTVGMSMKASVEESSMRQVGGSAHGGFKYLSQEEFDILKNHKLIKEMEYSIALGVAENKELIKRPSEIKYATDRQAELNFAKPTKGNMPRSYKEIAMDTIVLDYLGLTDELGQEVQLEYTLGEDKIKDTFILSGIWEGDKVIPASQIWISKEYLDGKLENFKNPEDNNFVGKINADVMFSNSSNINNKMLKVIFDSGYTEDDINYGVNWAYMGGQGEVDLGVMAAVIGGLLLIIFCGYLIIYNIFYISVSKDIRFYGLLKTIGTTSKQIGWILRRQALILSCIGIPIGLFLGYIVGIKITPMFLEQSNIAVSKLSLNPWIFAGAALFTLLTVLISVRKPAKLAGKVSPIEALRNTEGNSLKSTERRSNKGKLWKMAFANVFRSKKKALLVTISLSLSLIILNCTYAIAKGFDMDAYLSKMIKSDFVLADAGYFNLNVGFQGQDTLSEEFLNELKSQPGVKEIGTIRFVENTLSIDEELKGKINKIMEENPEYFSGHIKEDLNGQLALGQVYPHIYGLNKIAMDELTVVEGTIDYEKLNSGNYIIVSSNNEEGDVRTYEIGDKVKLDYGNGNVKEYEVMAVANIFHNLSIRHSHSLPLSFFISEEEYEAQIGAEAPMAVMMNVDENNVEAIEAYMKNYCENINKDMGYESKATYEGEFKSMQMTFLSVGMILSFIIAVIGIMNFINTMITSVISRKHELAMLQSIGMTKGQMSKMLIGEGLTYAILTSIFVLTLGSLISFGVVNAFMSSMWYFTYKFTITPVLICLPILFIIAVVVPVLCYGFTRKESIVERLRESIL